MTGPASTLDAIMTPLGVDSFRQDYWGKRPLHLEGEPNKFSHLMNWPTLSRLLGMTTIWSGKSMMLVLDKSTISPSDYAKPEPGRDGGQVLRPSPEKVKAFLKRGATLILNDIDQLTPEISAFSGAVEAAFGCKVQGNLYMSSKRKQGFEAHFDTHDVMAVQVEGEKTWFVFEGRADSPIAHPMFRSYSQAHHEQAKGDLWKEVRLKPGDLLYLPRGQYHYALADDGGTMHIAFGLTYPIGIDVMSYLFERMIAEPIGRANLPDDEAALSERLNDLGRCLADILKAPETLRDVKTLQDGFSYSRETYDLPKLLDADDLRFAVIASNVRLIEQSGRFGLVEAGSRKAVPVPGELAPMVRWVLDRQTFDNHMLRSSFPGLDAAQAGKLLDDLARMRLIEPEI
ncbi:MAG: cupin domain-containing protein [Pseudomonadota bacterium]